MIEQHESNRRRWEELTPVHARSEFYDVPGFLAGKNPLDKIVLEGVGDVTGKSLLHLQCHFGMDTLAWARLGANVTGVDFSESSIAQATALAEQSGLSDRARFLCCDVLELDRHLDEQFDVVFTSYGVITWLCDLKKWGEIVARFLKPGGLFFIAELHPFSLLFKEDSPGLEVGYDYFHDAAGEVIAPHADYADPSFAAKNDEHYWAWTLQDIFASLHQAGIEIRDFREYPFAAHKQFPNMEKLADGFWHRPEGSPKIPLLFSLSAMRQKQELTAIPLTNANVHAIL